MIKNNLENHSGNWDGDVFTGRGRYIYTNGDIYTGDILKNKKHGKGAYQYASNDNYEGEYTNDLKNGQGLYEYSDGSIYRG